MTGRAAARELQFLVYDRSAIRGEPFGRDAAICFDGWERKLLEVGAFRKEPEAIVKWFRGLSVNAALYQKPGLLSQRRFLEKVTLNV